MENELGAKLFDRVGRKVLLNQNGRYVFERLNEMIGMENALCAFYESPEAMHEYMEAICEYKLKCIDLAYQYLKPDVIHMHDGLGNFSEYVFLA